MSNALASQTLDAVSSALQSGKAASMADLMRIVRAISQEEAIAVSDLAALIQQDAGVLNKVIHAANLLGYNPSGAKITSVDQAIHIIGFARVRRLAMSLLLLEQANRATSPSGQREMAALSLCSGVIAQAVAEQMPLIDPEQAFVAAALRNFGRLVLGTCMTEEFDEARRLQAGGHDDEAYRTVFGLTPTELGVELLRSATLPEPLLRALRDVPVATLQQAAHAERRLVHVAKFALQLSEFVLDRTLDASAFASVTADLVQRYRAELPVLADVFPDLLRQAESHLAKVVRSAGGQTMNAYGLDRLLCRVKGRDPSPEAPVVVTAPAPAVAPRRQGQARPVQSLEEGCDLLQDPRSGSPTDIVLGALTAEFAPDDMLYCALPSGRGDFLLQQGRGPLASALEGKPLFRRHERNVFLLCHERLENIVVRDATDAKLLPYLPSWLRTPDAPRSFLLLPVHHQGRVHGVVLVGWSAPHPIVIAPERLALLRKLLGLTARAGLLH